MLRKLKEEEEEEERERVGYKQRKIVALASV
jgi:hypothetical protein